MWKSRNRDMKFGSAGIFNARKNGVKRTGEKFDVDEKRMYRLGTPGMQ